MTPARAGMGSASQVASQEMPDGPSCEGQGAVTSCLRMGCNGTVSSASEGKGSWKVLQCGAAIELTEEQPQGGLCSISRYYPDLPLC